MAEELEINARQLKRWPDAAKHDGETTFPDHNKVRGEELMCLKRQLAKTEQERDFLREAAAYFASELK